ncbi:hypothetical protein T440DRAFT_483917 [Plenodomus tracheiphilus IPT5]|uniref:Uncharacterized protein n=1 Tax=Plenodomus tracheiphilus IPT5 TaxID=1408161 RepID=A0A6A7AQX8_9PLEO|nr:hypothetical protein T440DRAFT_483917 [Plenodomus tracheiphilus IPT5]
MSPSQNSNCSANNNPNLQQLLSSSNDTKRTLVIVLRLPSAVLIEHAQGLNRRVVSTAMIMETYEGTNPLHLLAEAPEIHQRRDEKDVMDAGRALTELKNEHTALDILAEAATMHQNGVDAGVVEAAEILYRMKTKQ